MIYLVYITDSYHSYASRGLRGVYDTLPKAINAIKKNSKKIVGGKRLSEDDLFNLQNINQTQGHEGYFEWEIEAVTLNEWI